MDDLKITIVVLDDNYADLRLTDIALKEILPAYALIDLFSDPKLCLQAIKERLSRPDFLILDYQLPSLTGIDFLLELSRENLVKFPVIILSSFMREEEKQRALASGAALCLTKKENFLELAADLRTAIYP